MRITVLADNRKLDDSLGSEHGLCIYLETEHFKYLLDTGASDVFIQNAEKLGVDIQAIDFVFISHGHADHIGGIPAFLELNKKAKIVLSKNALNQKYFSSRNGLHSISLNFDFSPYADRFVFVDTEIVLNDEIRVFPANVTKYTLPKGNVTLFKDSGKGIEPDDFNHELVISFGTKELFIYTGCAHKGLLNILDSISLYPEKRIGTVVGGFHLLDSNSGQEYETDNEIEEIAKELKNKYPDTHFITGHCTGEKAYKVLANKLGEQINYFHTGYSIPFNDAKSKK